MICDECKNAAAYPEQPVEPIAPPVVDNPQEPFVLATPTEAKPKKSKKGLFIALGAIAVVAIAVVVLLVTGVFGGGASEEEVLTFDTPEEHFEYMIRDAVVPGSDSISALSSYNSSEVHILLGDSIQGLVEDEIGMSAEWLDDVSLQIKSSENGNVVGAEIGVGLGDTNILTVRGISDTAAEEYWIGIPELSNTYFSIKQEDIEAIFEENGVDFDEVAGSLNMPIPEIDAEKFTKILDKYLGIALDAFGEVTSTEHIITVNGVSQKCTKLTASLKASDVIRMCIALLKEAKVDQELVDFLKELVTTVDPDDYFFEEDFKLSIDGALEELEASLEDADSTAVASVDIYSDARNNMIGCTITNPYGESIYFRKATENGKFAFEAVLPEGAEITGSGTDVKGVMNGTFKLTEYGEEVYTLKISDCTGLNANGRGTVLLQPSGEAADEMREELGYAGSFGIEFGWNLNGTANSASYKVLAGDELVVGYSVKLGEETVSFAVPNESIDIVNDPEAIYDWVMDLNFDKLIENLGKTDLPKDLVEQLKGITDLLPMLLSSM